MGNEVGARATLRDASLTLALRVRPQESWNKLDNHAEERKNKLGNVIPAKAGIHRQTDRLRLAGPRMEPVPDPDPEPG